MNMDVVREVAATSRPADWLMVASLLVLAWFEIWVEPIFQTGMPGPRVALTLLCAVVLLPLLARRAQPLPALTVMCAGLLGVGIIGDPEQSTFVLFLGLLVAVYSVAAYDTARNAVVGAVVVVATGAVFEPLTFVDRNLADVLVSALFLAAAWVVGKEVHRQRQRAGELAQHAALLARTQQLEVQAAVAGERTRIARELHDVVAHAISVMGIQAGAARATLAPGQEAQHAALMDVERLGREALTEMERMLEVLRAGEDDHGVGPPLPDLRRVTALAADARHAGIEVRLDVGPDLDDLPAGLQLTAYRLVQEALTNVRKHTRANTVSVTITRGGDHLDILVADDGRGTTCEPEPGNGLIGMRERVAIHDGTLFAGPGDDGGFVVRSRLPVKRSIKGGT